LLKLNENSGNIEIDANLIQLGAGNEARGVAGWQTKVSLD